MREHLGGMPTSPYLATAGVVGVIYFCSRRRARCLPTRLLESEALVRQRDVDLANLAELSQYIVQHLRESMVVVDATDRIRLINESAAQILGAASAMPGALLGEVSPKLLYFLANWRRDPQEFQETSATFVAARRLTRRAAPLRATWQPAAGADSGLPRRHEPARRTRTAIEARGAWHD